MKLIIILNIVLLLFSGCQDTIDRELTNKVNDTSFFCDKEYVAAVSVDNNKIKYNDGDTPIYLSCNLSKTIFYFSLDNTDLRIKLHEVKDKKFILIDTKSKTSQYFSGNYMVYTYKILDDGLLISEMKVIKSPQSGLYNEAISYKGKKANIMIKVMIMTID